MPSDDGLWSNDYEVILPARPELGEGDPEGSVQRRESGSGAFLGIHRELLLKSHVDDRLLSVTSEEGEDAVKKQR
jgi:hypothetical protein